MTQLIDTKGVWLQYEDFDHKGHNVQATVWLNGEGVDITIDEEPPMSFHMDELHAIVVACKALGMVDFKDAKADAKEIMRNYKERKAAYAG